MFLLFVAFGCKPVIAEGNTLPAEKAMLAKTTHAVIEVCSKTIKIWRDPVTGIWESEEVVYPAARAARATGSSQKTVTQPGV